MTNTKNAVINNIEERKLQFPQFSRIVHFVCAGNPLQAKRLIGFITQEDDEYWKFCEDISSILNSKVFPGDRECQEAVHSYDDLCMRMLRDQIQFRKTGTYETTDDTTAKKEVYDQPLFMRKYMIGLLLTQMLWPNHYRLFQFFRSYIGEGADQKDYLEIGAGHGLFAADTLRRNPFFKAVICDVSQTSIDVCGEMLKAFDINPSNIQFDLKNFFDIETGKKQFDFITAGEVLEHVSRPEEFLRQMYKLVKADGRVYVSTCANCPAPDHVYHFHNVSQIRDMLRAGGFIIENEMFLPAENVSEKFWEEQLITVNYAAILKPKKRI